jgi:hypothetical protein
VRLFIAGNGKLNMATKPRSISQTIIGHGEIEQISAAAAAVATEAARAATREALKNLPFVPPIPPLPPTPPSGFSDGGVARTSGDSITVHDNHNVDLGHIEQQRLKVVVLASGSATAEGKVDLLQVQVMGSGNVNLGRLSARRAEVTIAGSGDVTVAPSDELKVTIMGSGDVHLATRPANIRQQIMGSGHVIPAN